MLEQLANSVTFYAHYIATKVGATGLTVTVDVWEVQKNGTATEIVTAGSATEIGDGLYRYLLVSGSVDAEGEYIAVFKTADSSVDQQHLPALWSIQRAGIENLDALVSSRSTLTQAQVNAEADQALVDYDPPTDAELDAASAAILAAIAGISASTFPAGAIAFTYTVTNSVGGLPLEGVEVWISTDNPAVNIVWKGDTDAFGVARDVNGSLPMLDAGTYYFWRQLSGFIFVNPDTEIVS